MHCFYDRFFEQGWCFFYKLTLTLLRILSYRILESEEMSEILDLIRLPMDKKLLESELEND